MKIISFITTFIATFFISYLPVDDRIKNEQLCRL